MLKRLTLLLALTFSVALVSTAQISSADIDKLIKTYPSVASDLAKLDKKYTGGADLSALQSYGANKEVAAIFKKHGWEDNYMSKITTIASGYTYVKMEKESQQLPAEQQVYMKQMLNQYQQNVTDKDISIIRGKFPELDKFFSKL